MLTPRLNELRGLVERARARKELRADVPTDVACAMIAGPLFLYYLALLAEAEVDLPGNLPEHFDVCHSRRNDSIARGARCIECLQLPWRFPAVGNGGVRDPRRTSDT